MELLRRKDTDIQIPIGKQAVSGHRFHRDAFLLKSGKQLLIKRFFTFKIRRKNLDYGNLVQKIGCTANMVLVGMRKYQAVYFFHFIIFKKLQNVGRIFPPPPYQSQHRYLRLEGWNSPHLFRTGKQKLRLRVTSLFSSRYHPARSAAHNAHTPAARNRKTEILRIFFI